MKTLECKQITKGLPPILTENDTVSIDLELTGLKEEQIHRPAGRLASIACSFDGESAFICFEEDEVPEFLNRISKATWIFHNSVFDILHLRRWATVPERKNMRDTMLIEKLLYSNYYNNGEFSLADLVRRYLKCYMPKEIRKEFIDLEGAMTKEQIEYACLDVIGTWLVDKEQQKVAEPRDKLLWDSMYNPHVWTALELGGFPLDSDAWTDLAEKNQAIIDKAEMELGKKYGHMEKQMVGRGKAKHEEDVFVPFNPSSPEQVKALFKLQGLDVESTGDKEVAKYRDEYPIVATILDYRIAYKRVSTYGLSYLKYVEPDGKVYTSLNISQAETGRDSSSAPPIQNILKDEDYRKCFIAGKGRKLSIYDYSGQEANLFAFITQDTKLIEIINSGKKLYIEIAKIAFNETVKKGSARYKVIKALVLGLMYGLTTYGFSRDNEVDMETAEKMFNKFFEAFPISARWIKDQQSHNREVTYTILGRKGHLHPYDHQWKTNALNNPMQGSGADMVKLAMKAIRHTDLYKKYYPTGDLCIVMQVHDEIILNCAESISNEVAEMHSKCMNDVANSIHPGIISRVEGGICDNWSEK